MDLRMPGMDGAEATRRIRAALPETQVLVLTTYADDESLFPALQAGARGYLTKDASAEEIEQAIRALAAGRTHLDPAVQQRLIAAVLDADARRRAQSRAATRRPDSARGRGAEADRGGALERRDRRRRSSSATRPSRPTSTASSPRPACATAHRLSATPTSTASPDEFLSPNRVKAREQQRRGMAS